jgi:hypothetical protein
MAFRRAVRLRRDVLDGQAAASTEHNARHAGQARRKTAHVLQDSSGKSKEYVRHHDGDAHVRVGHALDLVSNTHDELAALARLVNELLRRPAAVLLAAFVSQINTIHDTSDPTPV